MISQFYHKQNSINKNRILVMQWQVTILLYDRVASLTDLNLKNSDSRQVVNVAFKVVYREDLPEK